MNITASNTVNHLFSPSSERLIYFNYGWGRGVIREFISLFKRGEAYLMSRNIALILSLIDLVVKSEGGRELKQGEGLNAFPLLKKGGVCLLKRGYLRGCPRPYRGFTVRILNI